MDAVAATIGNMLVTNVQAQSVGKTDTIALRMQEAIDGMTGQVLPGGLGGVGSGFVEAPYSSSSLLFGAYGGLVDSSASSYSASSALFGPSMGLQDRQRPIMLADAGGNPENTLLAWEHAAKQAASDSANLVKGLSNTPIQFVNGGLDLGHAAVAGLEAVGVFPPGASVGKTPQIPYFQAEDTSAARSGNAAGFALSMFAQIPEQIAAKGVGLLDAVLPGQVARSASISSGSNAIRETVLANVTESQTARASSQFDRLARYDKAYSFYSETGFSAERTLGHLQGIDFVQPVSVVRLENSNYVQYVANGRIGNYFAPVDTPATMLGINPAGRTPILFAPTQPVTALQSTAARIVDTWTVPGTPFNAAGGGTQFFVPNKQFMRQVP